MQQCICVWLWPSTLTNGDKLKGVVVHYVSPYVLSWPSRRFWRARLGSRGKTGSFSLRADRVLGCWRAEPGSVSMHTYVTASHNTTYDWDGRKHILHLPLPLHLHPSLNNSTRTELQTKIMTRKPPTSTVQYLLVKNLFGSASYLILSILKTITNSRTKKIFFVVISFSKQCKNIINARPWFWWLWLPGMLKN